MRKWFFFALILSNTAALSQEVVQEEESFFLVTHSDGSRERYAVKWAGTLTARRWETGGPSLPFQGKFVDDRQCHWTIDALVTRRLFLLNAAEERFERPGDTTVLRVSFRNQGSSFSFETLRGQNCNDAARQFDGDRKSAGEAIRTDFGGVVDRDRQSVEALMKGWKDVKAVKVLSKEARPQKAPAGKPRK